MVATLLFTSRQAAQACSISERQLWAQTHPRGPIPCVRIGGSVRYSPEALSEFIRQQSGMISPAEHVRSNSSTSGK